MSRKTPASLVALIENHWQHIEWVEECLRVKREVSLENQADHILEKSVEYWIGFARGYSTLLEVALHAAGCYAGFQYVGDKMTVTTSDGTVIPTRDGVDIHSPEFKSWRVRYFQR